MITKQLDYGTKDPQVKELQIWLNANGFTVAATGPGSPGNETDYFGPATKTAVQKFQATNGIVSSGTPTTTGYGRIGPSTLAKLTSLGDKSSAKAGPTPTPTPTPTDNTYKIVSGDTLSKIASKFGTTIAALMQANPTIKDPNKIYAGATLNLPTETSKQPEAPKEPVTPVKDVQKQIEEIKQQVSEAESILDQAKDLGYKSDQDILIDPTTNKVLPPPKDGGDENGPPDGSYSVPEWLANNDYFKQLSPDEQKYLVQYYNVLSVQDEENQKILAQALQDAKDQADPYFAEQIRMAQDELTRGLGKQAGDFGSQKRDLELRIDQLKEDLATGKERLSVDQQAELARQQRTYEYQLENLIEGASHRGLTFSTKRALAESRLATEQTDIVESTKREFQRRITDLQTSASRGDTEAQNLLKDYERTYGENVTTLIRSAEKQLGTENLPSDLPSLPGVSPLGGVTGSLAEQKQTDILQRAEALANLRNPFL